MRSALIATTALAAALTLSACQRDHSDDLPPPTAADAPTAPIEPMTPPDDATTMRYRCESGHRVEIVNGGDTARVLLSDGRSVDIARVADASPPLYAGEALEFAVGSDGGTLGQDGVGGFDCTPAE
ncbi:MAG: hypothetical protein M3374_02540 [Pseudomonadota bacterium]|nr:hypothetical protein [Pseudomonadota bacterium]